MTKRVDNTVSDTLHFFYDAQGRAAFVEYEGTMYRYVHNLQGDVVGILDTGGVLVVEYKYDAWGKPLSIDGFSKSTLGALNPFRYRGYVWDAESGLYYLRSRYYNPILSRFINLDSRLGWIKDVISNNAYCYCKNSPIAHIDPIGEEAVTAVVGVSKLIEIAGACIAFFVTAFTTPRIEAPSSSAKSGSKTITKTNINWEPDENRKNHIKRGAKFVVDMTGAHLT